MEKPLKVKGFMFEVNQVLSDGTTRPFWISREEVAGVGEWISKGEEAPVAGIEVKGWGEYGEPGMIKTTHTVEAVTDAIALIDLVRANGGDPEDMIEDLGRVRQQNDGTEIREYRCRVCRSKWVD